MRKILTILIILAFGKLCSGGTIHVPADSATIQAGIDGADAGDTITTGPGNDEIHGQDGGDVISSGAGDDVIYGDDGNDTITAGLGSDVITAGDGDDTVYASTGPAGDGADRNRYHRRYRSVFPKAHC